MTNSSNNRLYIQYGCGWCAPAEWRNFDASPTLRFEKVPFIGYLFTKNALRFPTNVEYGDIVKGLPIKDNTCAAVYCSHVLEHLSLEDFRIALNNTYRILRKGGTFRLVLPDLEYYINEYFTDSSPSAAHTFMKNTNLGQEHRKRNIIRFFQHWIGNSQHMWMWDFKAIKKELSDSGFTMVRRANFGDALDTKFTQVEDTSRWLNNLGIECIRPH